MRVTETTLDTVEGTISRPQWDNFSCNSLQSRTQPNIATVACRCCFHHLLFSRLPLKKTGLIENRTDVMPEGLGSPAVRERRTLRTAFRRFSESFWNAQRRQEWWQEPKK